MEEIWKVPRYPDLPDWEFSTFGNVRLEFTKRPVKVLINCGRRRFRYMSAIGKNGKRAKYTTHDVAKVMLYTFKPVPPVGYTCVEHIDGDKMNDHIDNLRWTTRSILLKKSLSTK